jgi:uncharacterized phiE125 gp8 family phage protein
MSYKLSGVDRTTLPAALLPKVKLHVRVDYTDDDALLTDLTARAIDLYERKTGLSIFKADFAWSPDGFDAVTDDGVLCPAQPLATLAVTDSDNVDVTTAYQLAGNQIDGQASGLYLQPVDTSATMPDGLKVTAIAGYTDPTAIAPATLDSILRITAHLYANRESVSELLLRATDWWMDDLLVGAWVPRV